MSGVKKKGITFIFMLLAVCIMAACGTVTVSASTKYKVTFVDGFSGKEQVISSQTVKKGKAATAPAVGKLPTHKGFKFVKWNKSFSKVTGNLKVKAVWKQTHTIVVFWNPVSSTTKTTKTFNGKVYTYPGKVVEINYYKVGDKVGDLPKAGNVNGCTFKHWSNIKKGAKIKKIGIVSSKAVYDLAKYTVKYYAQRSGTAGAKPTGAMSTATLKYGQNYTIPSCGFSKKFYKFEYWIGDDGKFYKPGAVVKNLATSGTFGMTAYWTPEPLKTYTITYTLNGGTNHPSNPTTFTREQSFTIQAASRPGYEFVGWQGTGLNGKTQKTIKVPTGITQNLSFSAVWKQLKTKYTVTVDLGNGTVKTASGTVGQRLDLSAYVPSVKDAIFQGWKLSGPGTLTGNIFVLGEGNATITAVFVNKQKYMVTVDFGNGTVKTASGYPGDKLDISKLSPKKDGYVFTKWVLTGSGSIQGAYYILGEGNATLTAQYRPA